jgi:hypothetical protein
MYTTSITLGMIMFVYVSSATSQDMLPSLADYSLPDPAPDVSELEYKPPVDESIIPAGQ